MVSKSIKGLSCGVLLLAVIVLGAFAQKLVDRVVASVNGEPILESDVKLGELFYGTKDRKQVIDKLIDTYLIAQFLESKGGQVPQEYINKALSDIAKANNTDIEGLAKELAREGLTVEDLRRFLEKEILATQGLNFYLSKEIKVSQLDVELEKLKKGQVKLKRDIDLVVLDKKDGDKLLKLMEQKKTLPEIAKALSTNVESVSVEKGDLVEPLDKEVWKASIGSLVVAEDDQHIYLAQIKDQKETYSGVSEEQLREQIFLKKLEERREELISSLKKKSFVKILPDAYSIGS
ncbi:peptidylprolyl isomerase [Hydrogenobacter hydrogenophilus]|uniref:Peptidyl-prolyl cis-trans isomerase SurA n=1 Tax=Hydrogenobacter hydrogenophilus TaxID=35835 RepID=A0A285NNH2_9AQUI|nr:peptidylprolyl isomerase [Hydrogenobacter hydrogenophilus]SNZ10999.1 peptidyl-prolyl cis-trans isomerase SurA [Hydrogenobacter hydrogenophilus]